MAGRGRALRAETDAYTVPALVACLLCGAPHIVCKWTCTRVYTYGYEYWGERAATGTASSPSRLPKAVVFDSSPGLLRWRCCHGGDCPLQYVRACFMTHLLLTLGVIPYDDVYINIGVYIFIRKILRSCTFCLSGQSMAIPLILCLFLHANNFKISYD